MLADFCNCFGPPGYEEAVIDLIKDNLKDENLHLFQDRVGNLIVEKQGNLPSVTLNSSMDEAALFINQIKDDGLLAFETAMVMPHLLVGKQVCVGEKKLPGVIGFVPIHLQHSLDLVNKPIKASSLFIDIGTQKKDEALKWVKPGEWAVFNSRFEAQGDVIMGKGFDNRLAVATLVKLLKSNEIKNQLRVVFSKIRKTWLWGSVAAGEHFASDYNIMVESVAAADGPISQNQKFSQPQESTLGGGAVMTLLDAGHIASHQLFNHFQSIAKKEAIAYQIKQSSCGMSDGAHYHSGGKGNRVLAISIPTRYQNAPISMACRQDIESVRQLIIDGINSLPELRGKE